MTKTKNNADKLYLFKAATIHCFTVKKESQAMIMNCFYNLK